MWVSDPGRTPARQRRSRPEPFSDGQHACLSPTLTGDQRFAADRRICSQTARGQKKHLFKGVSAELARWGRYGRGIPGLPLSLVKFREAEASSLPDVTQSSLKTEQRQRGEDRLWKHCAEDFSCKKKKLQS